MAGRRVYASLSEMLAHSSEIVGEPSCDYLSEVLQDLRPSGASYGHCRLTRPWGVEFPHDRTARFHFVIHGDCWLRTAEVGPVQLHTGDVAFLPRGVAHVLSDMPQGRTKPLAEFPSEKIGQKTYRLSAGGGGSQTLMSCCSVNFDEPTIHPLLELMPPVLLVQGGTAGDTMLPTLLDAMADEVMEQRVGAATVLARLADVVITRLVRSWAENFHVGTTGWLAAIRDPKIGSALAAIHRRPGNAWSIEGLAKIAACPAQCFAIDLPRSSGCRRRVTLRDGECIWRAVGWAMSALQWPKRRSGSVTSRKRRSAVPSNVSWVFRPARYDAPD